MTEGWYGGYERDREPSYDLTDGCTNGYPVAHMWAIERAIRAEIRRVWGHYCLNGGAVLARAAIAAIEKAQRDAVAESDAP